MVEPEKSTYKVEALARGMRLLALFSERRRALRLTDMAALTGMPVPTTYRLVMTLVSEAFLERLPDGSYRPGIAVLRLGFSALQGLDLVQLSTSHLQRLAEATGETVNMAVLQGDQVLYLVRIRNADLVTANIGVGSTLPAVHTSIGKLLLANLAPADLTSRMGPGSFEGGTGPRAVRSLADLQRELARVRRDGYAVQDEELAYGLRSVAAAVRDAAGATVAGVNVAVQASQWSRDALVEQIAPQLLDTCRDISHSLGHH